MASATLTGKPGCSSHSSRVASRLPRLPLVMATSCNVGNAGHQLSGSAQEFCTWERPIRSESFIQFQIEQLEHKRCLGLIHLHHRGKFQRLLEDLGGVKRRAQIHVEDANA